MSCAVEYGLGRLMLDIHHQQTLKLLAKIKLSGQPLVGS